MSNSNFETAILSNAEFWKKENLLENENGYLLYENFYIEPSMVYGVSKVALCIAKSKNLTPLCIKGLNNSSNNNALTHSMNNNVIGGKKELIFSSILNVFKIKRNIFKVRSKDDLLNLRIDNVEIGKYIYDSILINFKIPEITVISKEIRKRILIEISYFYYFKHVIKKYNVKMMVLGDNVYRYGLLFELAKINKIECISPVNLNALSMRKYSKESEFNIHDRKPELSVLNTLNCDEITEFIEDYFSTRFSASIEQHDVLKAYSKSKKIYTKNEIVKEYKLKENLPIIILMNHIFCDAPHAYPDTLYSDYKEWFINTVKNLKKNKNINFLVKEHPSAALYNETGLVKKILKDLNADHLLLKDDVHSLTVLKEFDVVITCGGTIGEEFLYQGKPVVLASKPPYSGFGFTIEPETKLEYENLMREGIEKLPLLTSSQKETLNKVVYHDFILLDNYSDDLELGGQRFYMGRDFDYDSFYQQIIEYNKTPLNKQKLYILLDSFIKSNNKHLLREIK